MGECSSFSTGSPSTLPKANEPCDGDGSNDKESGDFIVRHKTKPQSFDPTDILRENETKRLKVSMEQKLEAQFHSGDPQHAGKVNETGIQCDKCNYMAPRANEFTRHAKHHSGDFRFSCEVCGFGADSQKALSTHKRFDHQELEQLRCELCDYATVRRSWFTTHHRRVHSEQPPTRLFKCNECDSAFPVPSRLKRHVARRHATEKKYKCTLCPYGTSIPELLDEHTQRHVEKKHL